MVNDRAESKQENMTWGTYKNKMPGNYVLGNEGFSFSHLSPSNLIKGCFALSV